MSFVLAPAYICMWLTRTTPSPITFLSEKALFLLYNQLESEKVRRVEGAEAGADE